MYHKPSETFVGQGRFGADAIQHAAIQEQRQNAVENPIAANVVGPVNNNAENLLDIDFDGAAPASTDAPIFGLDNVIGTSHDNKPVTNIAQTSSSVDDMMGLFDMTSSYEPSTSTQADVIQADLSNKFGGLDLRGTQSSVQPDSKPKDNNHDLLGIF